MSPTGRVPHGHQHYFGWFTHASAKACHRAGHFGPDPWGGFDTLTCSGKTLAVAIDGFLRFQAKERLQRAKIVPVLHRR
jgi:hypothetical protein